eukprot:1160011-Pelagomonas_calceolata.AAC.4
MSPLCIFSQVCIVAEQLLRLLHHCGMPRTDVDFLAGPGSTMGEVLRQAEPRSTLFTGSQKVAEKLAVQQAGKVCSKRVSEKRRVQQAGKAARECLRSGESSRQSRCRDCVCVCQKPLAGAVECCLCAHVPKALERQALFALVALVCCWPGTDKCQILFALVDMCSWPATLKCQALLAQVKVFLEDAGFDWKVLGPDVRDVDYVAWQCDQDAYACSGQKCSAQSMLFMHTNWAKAGLYDKLAALASRWVWVGVRHPGAFWRISAGGGTPQNSAFAVFQTGKVKDGGRENSPYTIEEKETP